MSDDTFDLPVRKVSVSEVVKRGDSPDLRFTQKHLDQLVGTGARVVADVSQIVKDLVAIAKIRQQADADIGRIEAETQRVVAEARAEVDRLAQVGQNIRTRAQAAVEVITQVTRMMETIPDVDEASRRQLIETLRFLVEATVSDGRS